MADHLVFVPRSVLLTNDASEPQHVANVVQGYEEVFFKFPSIRGTPTETNLDLLATILQIIQAMDRPVWVSIEWPEDDKSLLNADQIRLASLNAFLAEVDAVWDRFLQINRTDLIRGFHFPDINYSRKFEAVDGSQAYVDRAFSNQLIEKAHLLGKRCAIDSEHPSELLNLVNPPVPRVSETYQGYPLAPTLLGSDSEQVDVIIGKNPLWSQDLTGINPTAQRPLGSRMGEILSIATGWTNSNLKVWPYQEYSLMGSPSDLSGGVHLSSSTAKIIRNTSSFFEAIGFDVYGVGAMEQPGSRKVLSVEEIEPLPDVIPNEGLELANISSLGGIWRVESDSAVQFFAEDLALQNV